MTNFKSLISVELDARDLEPSQALLSQVLSAIERAERAKILRQLVWTAVGLAASFLLSGAAIFYLIKQAAASGFGEFLTTMFSDLGSALANWQDYGSYLLESMPVVPLIATLIGVGLIIVTGLMAEGVAERWHKQARHHFI